MYLKSKLNRIRPVVLALTIYILIVCYTTTAQVEPQTGQHQYKFEGGSIQMDYLLFLPESYNEEPNAEWPLILYFHGSGANFGATQLIRTEGLPKKLEKEKDFPFIVVSPHFANAIGKTVLDMSFAVDRKEEVNLDDISTTLETVIALVDDLTLTNRVDKNRIYATGWSQGAYFAWFIATAFPERFTAIAPVSGTGIVQRACELKTMPIWIFHGALDNNVLFSYAERMINAIEACGGNSIQTTVYPSWGHENRVAKLCSVFLSGTNSVV